MATTVAYADRLQSLQLQVEELRAALQDAQQGQENLQDENLALKQELENIYRWVDAEVVILSRRVATEEAHTRGNLVTARRVREDLELIEKILNKHAGIINSLKGLTPTPKAAEDKIEKLDGLLLSRTDPVTFAEVGKVLELGSRDPLRRKNTRKQNMTHFRRVIESYPDRYVIRSIRRGKVVTLTPEYRAKLKQDRR